VLDVETCSFFRYLACDFCPEDLIRLLKHCYVLQHFYVLFVWLTPSETWSNVFLEMAPFFLTLSHPFVAINEQPCHWLALSHNIRPLREG
jgi:hypothetical protein